MKIKLLSLVFLLFSLLSCGDDDQPQNDNPFLIEPLVNITLNLDLPQFNGLNFPGNSVVISQQGIRGIIVYNVDNTLYTAFDLTDPNHAPNECSTMAVEGIIATCGCDDGNSYDIVTGQHQQQDGDLFPLQQYRAIRTNNSIRISN